MRRRIVDALTRSTGTAAHAHGGDPLRSAVVRCGVALNVAGAGRLDPYAWAVPQRETLREAVRLQNAPDGMYFFARTGITCRPSQGPFPSRSLLT